MVMTAVDRAVGKLSFTTKAHSLEEGNHDPRFWRYFQPLATSSNPVRAVDDDMKKAVINELDPTSHPESKGKWPVLRNKVRQTLAGINQHYTATGTLDGLARFVFGMGQEDSSFQPVTDLSVPEMAPMALPTAVTDLSIPETAPMELPTAVTSLDTGAPGQAPEGAVTSLDTGAPGQAPAGAVTSLEPSTTPADSSSGGDAAASAARAAGAVAPAAARAVAPRPAAPAPRPAPAPAPSPSVWATIAGALATAAPAGAQIYSQVVAQDAQTQAAKTLAAARAQAAAGGGGILGPGGISLPANIGTYALYAVIGVAGIGGLMLLLNALKSRPSASPSK